MKSVVYIEPAEVYGEHPIKLTHVLYDNGWEEISDTSKKLSEKFNKIVYLGFDSDDGDMFACYGYYGEIVIYKGLLNSGRYE